MPQFFLPLTEGPDEAELYWQMTKSFVEARIGLEVSERRIFHVDYRHNEQDFEAEVGEPEPRTGEVCVAILESNSFLVCTPSRGAGHGDPILIGVPERVVDFDPPTA